MICISWGPPSPKLQSTCLARSKPCFHNYDQKYVGATQTAPLTMEQTHELQKNGYALNHARVLLGYGEHTFTKGRQLLKSWRHFQLGWASVDPNTRIKTGERFCVRVRELFMWVLSPLEILYVTDNTKSCIGVPQPQKGVCMLQKNLSENSNIKGTFSFGSGTLEGHLLAGEEMFTIKWEEDDTVWYEIFSFSRPAHSLAKVTYPYIQWRQKLFADQSTKAMLKEINN